MEVRNWSETDHGSEISITVHDPRWRKTKRSAQQTIICAHNIYHRILRSFSCPQQATMAAALPPYDNTLCPDMEARVGLSSPNIGALRRNKQSTRSMLGDQLTGGHSHMQGMHVDPAQALLDAIPAALKNAPGNRHLATAISHVADYAGQPRPDGCVAFFRNAHVPLPPPPKTTEYLTPGGIIFPNIVQAENFIRFLDANMWGAPRRVRWRDMTGKERFEWYKAYKAADYTHLRVEQFTLGLRGTDVRLITTRQELVAAARRSPSLVSPERIQEREGHVLANNHWTHAQRALPFGV